MLELKKSQYTRKPIYNVIVTGETKLSSGSNRSKMTGTIYEEDWDEVDTLFFAYVSKGTYHCSKWENAKYKFGEDFKDNEIFNSYLSFWHAGYIDDCLDLSWDSIVNVKVIHIDENGVISKIELPEIENIYASEEDFINAFEKAIEDKTNKEKQSCIDNGDKYYIQPWELKKAKKILKYFGWKDEDCENMFFMDNEIGFCKIETAADDHLLKCLNNQTGCFKKISIDGHIYSRFKAETLAIIEKVINSSSDITDTAKKFAIEILKSYDSDKILDKHDLQYLQHIAYDNFKQNSYGNPATSTNGYNGVHIWEYDSMEEFLKFNDFGIDEENIADYGDEIKVIDNKVYMIHEGD